jgi:hypothetical protein
MASTAVAKPKAKQRRLPGTENSAIQELEDAAAQYADIRDQRMELTKSEAVLKGSLLVMMKAHKKKSYTRDGISIEIIPENEKVKVRIKKDKEEDE